MFIDDKISNYSLHDIKNFILGEENNDIIIKIIKSISGKEISFLTIFNSNSELILCIDFYITWVEFSSDFNEKYEFEMEFDVYDNVYQPLIDSNSFFQLSLIVPKEVYNAILLLNAISEKYEFR